jgi:subtilisin family serine protease
MRNALAWILALICVLFLVSPSLSTALAPVQTSSATEATERSADVATSKVAPGVLEAAERAAAPELVPIIITLNEQADLSGIGDVDRDERVRQVVEALQDVANTSQIPLVALLAIQRAQGLAGPVTRFWVFNGLAVSVHPVVIEALARRPDVARITPDEVFQAPSLDAGTSAAEPNISAINAPALWDLGYTGQGIVVANVDTGVYLYHPDLNPQWRGGTNSWYDPYYQHPDTPTDLDGHGTQTMGVMVGRDAGGTAIGVAPDAQWIAVKIFNDQGQATTSGIHAGYQWLLDPDGNPNTADAPHVVNSSWSFSSAGCNLEFQLDLQALRAANILPVFSAGNFGPYSATSASPANNPEAFAVGAIDDFDQIYTYSSRGPSSCGEAQTVFPEIVSPGVGIRTTERYSTYTDATGTSVAAPHAAGALALLLSAYPQLTADEQADALLAGAFDLGSAGPDNAFGYGRLDVQAAYQYLLGGGPPPTPTPAPTATPTAAPTATPDPNANLALNRPATVSSIQDDTHTGDQAVDGDLNSYWQTKKAVGRNVLPSEWIIVDLGSSMSVSTILLEWDSNYATSYSIQVSNDASTWTPVFNTTAGDGGSDAVTFTPVTGRYVKLDSTAWSSASQRNWLRELEIYAGSVNPPPPDPPTPTPTPGATTTVHIGDLDGSSALVKNRWNATLSILVHDAAEVPIGGATVSGVWTNGVSGGASCVTNSSGWCDIAKTNLKTSVTSVTFTVNDIAASSAAYESADNHDPDQDSDGTTITVSMP